MFTKTFQSVSWVLFGVLGFLAVVTFTSCRSTYEIHASSDFVGTCVADQEIVNIFKDGKSIPFKEWKIALESGDYVVIPVASPDLRQKLSEEER
jgi:hypothetical protein